MKVRNLIGIGAIALSAVATGCDTPLSDKAKAYLHDKPQKEINSALALEKRNPACISYRTKVQSCIDSVAFREVFNAAQAMTDSTKVREFNKLAAKGLMDENSLEGKLLDTKIPDKEYGRITGEAYSHTFTTGKYYQCLQFETDSINYCKFFKKNGLWNKKIVKLVKNVSAQIKP